MLRAYTRNRTFTKQIRFLSTSLATGNQNEVFADIKPEQTQVNRLKNGVRVATLERFGNMSSIHIFVGSGARDEAVNQRGATHVISHLLLKETTEKTAFRLTRETEQAGISVSSSSFHDAFVYACDALRPCSSIALNLLAESLLKPALLPWEVKAAIESAKNEIDKFSGNPQALIVEYLHTAGYAGKTLGKPIYVRKEEYDALSPEAISSYLKENIVGDNICVVGTNVNASFVSQCEELFGKLPQKKKPAEPATYTGGDFRIESEAEQSHIALGFEGVKWGSDLVADVSVLSKLLGGGLSFSAGGPGKGIYSKLYQEVLVGSQNICFAHAYQIMYSDSGLFGVIGSARHGFENELVNSLAKCLAGLKNLTEEEVNRAKVQLKSNVALNLESRQIASDDFARQILAYDKRFTSEDLYKMIDKVNLKSLQKTVNIIFQSQLTVVAQGNLQNIPSYRAIAGALA